MTDLLVLFGFLGGFLLGFGLGYANHRECPAGAPHCISVK